MANFKAEIKIKGDNNVSGSKSSGGSMGMLGGKGALGKMAGWLAILIPIAEGISSVLKPLMGILKSIGRVVGEIIRPFVEFLQALLIPILVMLRPFVTILRAMLMPFRKTISTLTALFMKQFNSGDPESSNTFLKLIAAASLPLGMVILEVSRGLLKVSNEIVAFAMKGLFQIGVLFFELIAKGLDKALGTDLSSGIEKLKSTAFGMIDSWKEETNGTIDSVIDYAETGLMALNDTLFSNAKTKLDEVNKSLNDGAAVVTQTMSRLTGLAPGFYDSFVASSSKESETYNKADKVFGFINNSFLDPISTAVKNSSEGMIAASNPALLSIDAFGRSIIDSGKSAMNASSSVNEFGKACSALITDLDSKISTLNNRIRNSSSSGLPSNFGGVSIINGRVVR